jgi:hypothetical protein
MYNCIMRAVTWRRRLIGDRKLLTKLRNSELVAPDYIRELKVIDDDLVRTFPQDTWFNDHHDKIKLILSCYAEQNPSMGYAQGMCFIVFPLYRVYYNDCPEHAAVDTFFSLHTIMHFLRPLYPRSKIDVNIRSYLTTASSIIRIKLLSDHIGLATRLRNSEYIQLLLIKSGPSLFANWFDLSDTETLWDYIFHGDLFENLMHVICAMLVVNKEIYMGFSYEKILEIIQVKDFYRVSSLVSCARTFQR